MPCIHNQARIAVLEADIASLEKNIAECEKIIVNHMSFRSEINCVMHNLVGNTVDGGSYDKGKMEECYDMAKETIDEASKIISESKIQISFKEAEIATLQGDCEECDEPVPNEK